MRALDRYIEVLIQSRFFPNASEFSWHLEDTSAM